MDGRVGNTQTTFVEKKYRTRTGVTITSLMKEEKGAQAEGGGKNHAIDDPGPPL